MVLRSFFRLCYRWRRFAIAVFLSGIICAGYFIWLHVPDTRIAFPNQEALRRQIESTLKEALELDKGRGCELPVLDPFAWEAAMFDMRYTPLQCEGQDWVECYHSTCRLKDSIKTTVTDVVCSYRDILYHHDNHHSIGRATRVRGGEYKLNASDHVKVTCTGKLGDRSVSWSGIKLGFRPVTPSPSPPGREDNFNVLMFGFDSTSRTGFIRLMPESWAALNELGATVMQGYNIVGDGTPAALIPILTGRTPLELPEVRKGFRSNYTVDSFPLLFYNVERDGYRTAYFEDSPGIGLFQRRYTGFRRQPVDHYLRAFSMEHRARINRIWLRPNSQFCVGDTPQFKLMMNITQQFLELDGKRFIFTFIVDITHENINYIEWADNDTAALLRGLKRHVEDTLIVIMADHGPRYTSRRLTLRGKLDERLPLMAIRLPTRLRRTRPSAQRALEANAHALTTPHDLHTTILDVLDLRKHWYPYRVPGSDFPRGLTMLEPIPRNRSCSDAGIEPHWCSCLVWQNVSITDPIYHKIGIALVQYINELLYDVSSQCAPRTLTSIEGVTRQRVNSRLRAFHKSRDRDHYVGRFNNFTPIREPKERYQVKIEAGPGRAMFEATMTYRVADKKFTTEMRDISRINAYGNEPECISRTHPHLAPYCYCRLRL